MRKLRKTERERERERERWDEKASLRKQTQKQNQYENAQLIVTTLGNELYYKYGKKHFKRNKDKLVIKFLRKFPFIG